MVFRLGLQRSESNRFYSIQGGVLYVGVTRHIYYGAILFVVGGPGPLVLRTYGTLISLPDPQGLRLKTKRESIQCGN